MSAGRGRDRRGLGASALVALLLCALVSACTPDTDPHPSASSPTSPTSASPTGPVTLRFAVYGAPGVVAAYRRLAATYTRQHPRVTVTVDAAADATTAAGRLNRSFEAGNPPDLFLTPQAALPALMAADRVQPVDQLLEQRGVEFGDNFQRLGLEGFAGDSALQCMPNEVSPYVVFYNRRMLAPGTLALPGEDPPTPETGWTWAQFTAAARQMSHDGVKGLSLAPTFSTLMPLVRSAGADVVDDPRKPTTLTFADDTTRAALEQILPVARDPSITPTAAELARQDAVTRFENGRVGMILGTRALVPRLREKPDLHFDVFPLPSLGRVRTVADMTGYCISQGSEHVPETADFLAFASGDRGSQILADSGAVVPANIAALHSQSFTEPGEFPRNSAVFDEVIRRADPMPATLGWPSVVSMTRPLLDRMFYAPVIDLDTLLPRLDEISVPLLAVPTASPSPSGSASAN